MKHKIILFFLGLILAFPPVANKNCQAQLVINEVLANEPGSRTTLEWVEIFNTADSSVNLKDWVFIEDEDTTEFDSLVIGSKGYLILARNFDSFVSYWGTNFSILQVKMGLTNTEGQVYLVSPAGEVQTFAWKVDPGDGISWEKINPISGDGLENWDFCVDLSGSTPGEQNSLYGSEEKSFVITLSPNPFSPDGDGFKDWLQISYELPLRANLTLKIYDFKGRLVKTLLENSNLLSGIVSWDGKDEDDSNVKMGMYILLAEAGGSINFTKKIPIAVARK